MTTRPAQVPAAKQGHARSSAHASRVPARITCLTRHPKHPRHPGHPQHKRHTGHAASKRRIIPGLARRMRPRLHPGGNGAANRQSAQHCPVTVEQQSKRTLPLSILCTATLLRLGKHSQAPLRTVRPKHAHGAPCRGGGSTGRRERRMVRIGMALRVRIAPQAPTTTLAPRAPRVPWAPSINVLTDHGNRRAASEPAKRHRAACPSCRPAAARPARRKAG